MKSPTVLSLFSGAGGLDLGFRQAGFHINTAVENDRDCQNTLRANDARMVIFSDAKLVHGRFGQADIIIGGPPCQSFSKAAGAPKGMLDPRGSLFREFTRIVGEVRPALFVAENVRGLMTSRLPDGEFALDIIANDFKAMGYAGQWALLRAEHYGVPQARQRLFIIGRRSDLGPIDGDFFESIPHQAPQTFRQAVDGVQGCTFRPYPEKQLEIWRQIPEGGQWRSLLDKGFTKEQLLGGARNEGGMSSFWRRLAWDKPAPTLVTSPSQKSTGFCHPDQDRPLSVEEYKRLQQFPDDYIICGSAASKYRQIGNAVPVGLASVIARTLLEREWLR